MAVMKCTNRGYDKTSGHPGNKQLLKLIWGLGLDIDKEYFGLLTGRQITIVVVATSRVLVCSGEARKVPSA